MPFLFLIALVSTIITYFLVGFHSGIDRFAYFVLSLLACLAVVESLMMAVASVVPNFLMGIITGAGIQVINAAAVSVGKHPLSISVLVVISIWALIDGILLSCRECSCFSPDSSDSPMTIQRSSGDIRCST